MEIIAIMLVSDAQFFGNTIQYCWLLQRQKKTLNLKKLNRWLPQIYTQHARCFFCSVGLVCTHFSRIYLLQCFRLQPNEFHSNWLNFNTQRMESIEYIIVSHCSFWLCIFFSRFLLLSPPVFSVPCEPK